MPSIQVSKREKSTRAVVAAADAHKDEIAAAVKKELSPHLKKGEAMPDLALLVELCARHADAKNAALVAADEAHDRELADDAGPREERDASFESLRTVMVDTRKAVESAYGAAGLTKLGLGEAVAYDPSVLATTTKRVIKALRDSKIKLAKPVRAGIKIDRAAFADELEAELPALDKALKDVAREVKEAQVTVGAKQDAMAANDRVFSATASLIEAAAKLGGLTKIAETVRPSERSAGQTAVAAAAEPPAADPAATKV